MDYTLITIADIQYIKDKIRNDFDALDYNDPNYENYGVELINRAQRFGFTDLVEQMKKDL